MFSFLKRRKKQEQNQDIQPDVKSFDLPYSPELTHYIFPRKSPLHFNLATLTELVSIYGNLGYVFACVSYIAMCLRLIKVEVIDPKSNKIVPTSSSYRLLTKPNKESGFSRFLEAFGVSTLLTGNFYCEIVKVANNYTKSLEFLQPHRVKYENDHYIYMESSTSKTELKPEQVFHVKTYNPMDDIYGFPQLLSTESDINVAKYINVFLENYFKNGTILSGIIEADRTVPDKVVERLKKVWRELYSGVKNAFKIPILEGGLKFRPISSTVSDSRALEISNKVIEKILAVFKVPPELLGLREQRASVLREVRKAFWEDTIMPFASILEEALNTEENKRKLFPKHEQEFIIKFNYDSVPALKEDRLTLARVTAILVDRGIMTRNEIRERFFKLPPVEGGDEFLIPLNMMQVDSERKPENEGLGRPASDVVVPPTKPRSDKSFVAPSEEDWLLYHGLIEVLVADKVSKIYSEQRERVKTRITSMLASLLYMTESEIENKLSKEIDDVLYLTKLDLEDTFSKVADRIYYEVAREIEPTIAILSSAPKELEDFIIEWADDFNKWINETTKKDIIKAVSEAVKQDVQLDIMVNKVFNKLTDIADGTRLQRIVRTETTFLLNGIRLLVYKRFGYKYKTWRCVNDERTRPAHREVDGKKVKIDEYFIVGGYKAEAPASLLLPPHLRISCRCWLVFSKE